MKQNIKVTAEHNELILENTHGDKVIIPANKRDWVKQKLSEGCHTCIDSLVETLPIASQYAGDGSVYPPNKKVKVNQDNQIKEYDISSQEYKDLYNSGKLTTYDKNTDIYIATPLKEVTTTAEAPQWSKYKREYERTNPKSDYINQYLNPFARSLGNTETNYPKRLDDEYEQKSLDYVSEQLIKNKPQGKHSRAEWLNQMSDKEEELIKRNPKYQSSLWADTKRGLTSLVEQNPLQTFQNILNSSDYTNREKQEMLKDYADHPVMSKLGDAAKILNPLTVPSKMVQSAYKDDYSFTDALKGKKNNAGIVEDIVTDPLNLVGVGLAGKLSKADKAIDATKAGSKVLNKTDDVVKNLPKFESEVNWANWNKEIPNNKPLIQEYNAIEETTKANGTWMKNPDGSAFNGTPEQFIQQLSNNFKKAFPNIVKNKKNNIQINYHGTPNGGFEEISKDKFKTGEYGKGFYTSAEKEFSEKYLKGNTAETRNIIKKNNQELKEFIKNNEGLSDYDENLKELKQKHSDLIKKQREKENSQLYEFYINSKKPMNLDEATPEIPYKDLGKDINDYPTRDEIKNSYKEFLNSYNMLNKSDDEFDSFIQSVMNGLLPREKVKLIHDDIDMFTYDNSKIQMTPFSNILKSAKNNNGMFDMTNPNIFKSLIPPTLMYYLQSQNQNKNEQ